MPLFRFYCGNLQDSLKTTVIVKNITELMNVIKKCHKDLSPPNISNFNIIIAPYPDKNENFDKRIGWFTQMVSIDIYEKGVFRPEGFLSEPLE